ncbi:MAG: hypothetical protein AMJ77_04475 [Dehalococcoidia bacterium SM23_28_2]|nr:MAG: hypothetical protein AMJ77_04475 [Dehalococcoidia bacterium SM23_28_2]
MPTEEQIKKLAHSLWEQEGRPEGRDMQHYLAAREILQQREGNRKRPKASKASKSTKARTGNPRAKKK